MVFLEVLESNSIQTLKLYQSQYISKKTQITNQSKTEACFGFFIINK